MTIEEWKYQFENLTAEEVEYYSEIGKEALS